MFSKMSSFFYELCIASPPTNPSKTYLGPTKLEAVISTFILLQAIFFGKNMPVSLYFLKISFAVDNFILSFFDACEIDKPSESTPRTNISRFYD